MEHINFRKHLDKLADQIRSNKNLDLVVRSDLAKMLRNCNNVYTELDKESVDCRRLKKVTSNYKSLCEKLQSMVITLEKRITWANLL